MSTTPRVVETEADSPGPTEEALICGAWALGRRLTPEEERIRREVAAGCQEQDTDLGALEEEIRDANVLATADQVMRLVVRGIEEYERCVGAPVLDPTARDEALAAVRPQVMAWIRGQSAGA